MAANLALEDIIRELQELATLRPLKGEQQARARELMSELKRRGFTNEEISQLTSWDESTIKQLYTRGVAAEDSTDKRRAIELLAELAARRLTLDDVEEFLPTRADLDARGLTFDVVGSFLQEARRSNVPLTELIRLAAEFKRSGLSIANAIELLAYKGKLDGADLTVEMLTTIYEATKTLGNPAEVLKAITAFKTLAAIEVHIQELVASQKRHEGTVEDLNGKIRKLQEEMQRLQSIIDLVARLVNDGFDEPALKRLTESCAKYGGVRGVTEAINTFADLTEIQTKIKDLKKQRAELETSLKQVQADWAQLMPVVKMVETLLYELKFSVQAITQLFRVAKIYGTPVDLLEALGKYGGLKQIQEKVDVLCGTKDELEARIQELRSTIQQLRGLADEIKNSAKGMLQPIAGEVAKALDAIATEYSEYAEKLGQLKAEVARFDQEVKLARAILAASKFPAELKDISSDYIILMFDGVEKLCHVKGLNPKVQAGGAIEKKYYVPSVRDFELFDLLEWVGRGLRTGVKGA